jgi:hypothetical protein
MTLRKTSAVLALTGFLAVGAALAASHREAPLMTLDPAADISDFYAFVSYDDANLNRTAADRKVTFIMNVVPSQDPSSGPNSSGSTTRCSAIHIDNDKDGEDDLTYEIRFATETVAEPVHRHRGAPAVTAL